MARWHSCNVLMRGAQTREIWQFNAGGKFTLQRKESKLPSEALPAKMVGKDWQSLFQPRLNVAWLPPDKVFIRSVQLPKADEAETRSMVELQLEKISPVPAAQLVWSFEVVPYRQQAAAGQNLSPHATGELQTVVVIMAGRELVEQYLGELEGQGFLADRLELPLLDELKAVRVEGNGAWIFPNVGGIDGAIMVAWWYDGVLQNLSVGHLPAGEARARVLQEQLAQTSWAGEVEGWLSAEPRFYLVAGEELAAQWLPLFDPSQPLEVVPPLPVEELAGRTARRAAANGTTTNLLPPEFSSRYRQQFVDGLWMSFIGAVVALYVLGVLVYFGFVQVASYRYGSIQDQMVSVGPTYTNTVQLRERLKVLQDTLELQYAALDCYKSAADTMPSELTLNSMTFERGRKVTFFGSAGSDDRGRINEFNSKLLDYAARGQKLFSKVNPPNSTLAPGQSAMNWNFSCDLKRTDTTE